MRKLFEFGGVAAAVILIAFGIATIVMGFSGKSTVNDSLKQEQIVGTPDMTPDAIAKEAKEAGLPANIALPTKSVANETIDTGDEARTFASYMRIHALEATGGQTYAQMPRYATDDGQGTNDSRAGIEGREWPARQQPGPQHLGHRDGACDRAQRQLHGGAALALLGRRRRGTPAGRLRLRDPRDRRSAPEPGHRVRLPAQAPRESWRGPSVSDRIDELDLVQRRAAHGRPACQGGETDPMTPKFRVVIAGGGVAALEAMIALRQLAEDRVEITLVAPDSLFVYRPLAVAEPFGLGSVIRFSLETLAAGCGATYEQAAVRLVSPETRSVHTSRGESLEYDALLLAFGARAGEGLHGAVTFGGPNDIRAIQKLLRDLESGVVRRVAFAVPTAVGWTLPLYELALLTADRIERSSIKAELVLVTPEEEPLGVFGGDASSMMRKLLDEHAIALRTSVHSQSVSNRLLHVLGGQPIAADRVLTIPRATGRYVPGILHDADGFIPTDRFGRVDGLHGVYAAGDGTSFPIKQGGIAAQQADAAAEAIAVQAGVPLKPTPFDPVLRGLILTGGQPASSASRDRRRSRRHGVRPRGAALVARRQDCGSLSRALPRRAHACLRSDRSTPLGACGRSRNGRAPRESRPRASA